MAWQAQYYQLKGEEFIAHLYSHLILSKQELTFNYSLMQILEACFTKGQNEGIFISHYAPEHMAKLMFQSLLAQTAFGRWDTEDGGIEGQIKGDTQQVLDLFIAMERA